AVEAVATRPPPTDGKRRRMGCPVGEGPADIRSHIALDMNRKELPVGDGDAAIPVAAAGPDEPVAIGDPYRHDLVEAGIQWPQPATGFRCGDLVPGLVSGFRLDEVKDEFDRIEDLAGMLMHDRGGAQNRLPAIGADVAVIQPCSTGKQGEG